MQALLDTLQRLQIQLSLDGDKLLLNAPQGVVTDEIRAALRERKPALIEHLRQQAHAASTYPPLSHAQQRLWFLDRFEPASATFNTALGLRLQGHLDTAALQAAINDTVARHAALRTTFALHDEVPYQHIAEQLQLELAVVELGETAENERDEHALVLARIETEIPFDLQTGPLLRATVYRIAADNHLLLLVLHHIVTDGWSSSVLVNELAEHYRARLAGDHAMLPQLAMQYADFARWQRQWLASGVLRQQLDYWRNQLADVPVLLSLPTDHPRPVQQSFRGTRLPFAISAETSAALHQLGRQSHATLFMVLHALFSILLSRHAGQHDICIGTPVAGRQRSELEPLIGLFVNLLVLRTQVDDDEPFAVLLQRVRQTTFDAYEHQDVPFDQLIDELKPERHTSHAPLFQAMLVLQSTPAPTPALPGLTLDYADLVWHTAKYDLTLDVQEVAGELRCAFEYNTDLFERSTVTRLAGHFQQLVSAVVAEPATRVGDLQWLTAAEISQLLDDWTAPAIDLPAQGLIHQLLEAQAARTPDALAAVCGELQLSYDTLNMRANRLAHYLRQQGVGPDRPVGVCTHRSLDMLVALLAILKAGGAYVPLDPAYPPERLALMLDDAKPALLLTEHALLGRFDSTQASLCLDKCDALLAGQPANNPPDFTLPAHLAYIIYTSGSTGRPKGVAIQHGNAAAFIAWACSVFDRASLDRVLAATSMCFDLSIFEMFVPLAVGGSVWIARDVLDVVADPAAFPVTLINTVPSAIAALHRSRAIPPSVRVINLAGEALPNALVQALYRDCNLDGIYNLYGPTEDTTYSTFTRVPKGGRTVTIGRPIAGSRAYVLDASLRPVAIGVAGELYLAGAGLARGYLHRPDLTAERFLPDPFSHSGERMYRTGDLVRYLADGEIEYLGRIDHQVKVRGFRVELGEIEAAFAALPAVCDVVVLAREDVPGEHELSAYLVMQAGADTAALRKQLASRLPDYMLPAHIIALERLPLTPNGKVDRKALPAPQRTREAAGFIAPRNERESRLADIWAGVLKLDRIGVEDNFFEAGGNSLLAVTLVERMRSADFAVDIRGLFTTPTIAAVAAQGGVHAIQIPSNLIPPVCGAITPDMLPLVQLTQKDIALICNTVPGGGANVQDIYPLAPLQEGILFQHLLHERGDTYLLKQQLTFDTRTTLDRFVAALQAVIDRHDTFRTAIVWEGLSEPVQVVLRAANLPIAEVTLAALGNEYNPCSFRLELNRAPLMHACIAQSADGSWVLQLLHHHLISDHTTLEQLFDEVRIIMAGNGLQLPLPLPFRNFIAQTRLGASTNSHDTFFQRMLADVETPTAPYGVEGIHGSGTDVIAAHVELPAAIAQQVRTVAQTHKTSTATLMHLAWGLVLARLTGQTSVVFGTILFGRLQGGAGADRVMGLCINTLPIRLDLAGTVRTALQRAQTLLTELLQHEQASLVQAQRQSGLPAGAPLFSSLLNYRYSTRVDTALQLPEGMQVLRGEERTSYPLTVSVDDLADGFALSVLGVASVHPRQVCDYFAAAVAQLSQALANAPDAALASLDILPAAERQQLLYGWNQTERACPPATLASLFAEQANRHPYLPAARQHGHVLSYAELEQRANQLAHALRARGVGPEVLVGLCAERSFAALIGLLGIVKAGGAYLPLDPALPPQRLAHQLADAAPALVLTHGDAWSALNLADIPTLALDAAELASQPLTAPEAQGSPDQLAYVMYTSGSTGVPKGVAVTQRNILRLVCNNPYFSLQPGDKVLHLAPITFDAATFELWAPLLHGGTICLPAAGKPTLDELGDFIADEGIDLLWLTSALFNQMVDHALPQLLQAGHVFAGGEALSVPHVRAFVTAGGRLSNGYGPTESTTFTCTEVVDAGVATRIPIGRPIANTRVYLLDANLQPVPVGVAGELYIAGIGLARGYLNRPDLSAERFLPDPYGPAGSRMYRSGDLARWLPDGRIDYLGRSDQQVKLRGFRIELGEIEATLLQQPAIRDAVVVARQADEDTRLVAYLVAQPEQAMPDGDALRSILLRSLPDYMVPAYFIELEQLPLTPNGKVDRQALPAPQRQVDEARYVAPRTATEARLAAIWAGVLKLDRVGVHDNFFALGGHSLLATQLCSQLRRQFAQDVPLRLVFDHPTVAGLAAVLQATAPSAAEDVIRPVSRQQALPLSFAQQRLWFLDQLEPHSAAYNIPAALRLRGALDLPALQQALTAIVQRHEVLRTRFARQDAESQQIIDDAATCPIAVVDLSLSSGISQDDAVIEALRAGALQPFDLAKGSLLRAQLIRLAEHEHLLALTLHHIVADGWSMGVLLHELVQGYRAARLGQHSQLPQLPIQYADFAHWQRQWLSGDVLDRQRSYWQQQLTGIPALLALPTDRPRPAVQTTAGASHLQHISAPVRNSLSGLAGQYGATPFMLLTAAFQWLLARYSGQRDICIGTPIANRNRAELENLIGFFVNTLVLRAHIDPQQPFDELLGQVRASTLAAYAHQDLPFEQLVEALNPVRDPSHSPLFQVLLVLQNQPMQSADLAGLTLTPVEVPVTAAKFDLTVNILEQPDGWALLWEYNTDLFDGSTIARMAGHYATLLDGIVAHPQARCADLPWLTATERQQVLLDWNATSVAHSSTLAIHQLFEQQADAQPDAPALLLGDAVLSYAQLDARANQLAHALRSAGVGPDVCVGVCLSRSFELVIALLAILKAGGAYVPLDPAYPPQRLAHMLADASPRLVLAEQVHAGVLSEYAGPVWVLDQTEQQAKLTELPTARLNLPVWPEQLAYVIYTSGSTGVPKGVGIDHAGILNRLQWMQAAYRLTNADRVMQKTPFSFDVSVWEFFWPLGWGAQLVLAKPGGHQEPAYLAELIQSAGITTLHFVPPMLEVFLASADAQKCASLRQIVCSGQALPLQLQQRCHALLPHVAVHNLYGPTEASVDVTAWTCTTESTLNSVPIGKPIDNIRIYLLDDALQPVPVGVAGELYIAGIGLARGYLNRPDLSAERFLPDPYGPAGSRMYRSGDLARWLPDGRIDYLGRSDQQVKLRGFRIELGEIEATLLQQPAIRDAVVVARQDDEDTRLVAYLVAQPEQAMPDGDALRSILLRSLPDYMVPAYFIELEQLPLTPNGKVDRQALPAPQREVDEDRYVAPRTETEARLAQIWAGVLKLDRVGVHDNFFALGGHSLLAVALIDAMRQAGLPAEVRSIFTHPTVATMVQALGDTVPALQIPPNLIPAGCNCITPDMLPLIDLAQSAIDAIAASVPGGMANIQDIYPLAPLQEGMLFHHLLDEAGDAYLAQLQFAFASRALLDSFIAALQTVIARHDILRTAVHWQELAEPVQVVLRTASLPVEWLVLAPDDGDIAVQLGTRYDPRSYRLNVSHAPMMQAFVAEDTEHGRWVLHLLQHHLIDDNLTLQLLFDEVRRIMQGEQDQLPQALPFRDFIAQTRLGTSNAEHEAFFCHMLADVDETTAPFGVVDVLGDGSDVSETRHALPRALSLRLREQARNHLVNTASLMHLAWALVLARLAGRDDVVFGTVLFGRMQGGGEAGRMMGPCINTLPLRLNVGNISLRDALVGTHDMLVQLLQHEHAPLSLAQRCSGIAAPQPLFTSLINCRRVQAETNSHTLDGCEIILAEERTNLPFVLSVDDVGDDLVLTAQIGAGIPAQRIHDYMHAALAGIADGLQRDAGMRIVTLNVLPEYELQQRRSRTTTRSFALSDTATLITGFEAQAARTPENTAIAYGADTLSYAALNRQANRLAHQLRASGVGPDVLVGLCAERSPELLVGLLAILKAGGAYLPLDPAYPQERLAYMLADAQPRLVLTQTAVRDVLPAETNIINLDDAASASDGNAENPAQLNGPDHLAYVIYTSGSTGKPKGALLPHRNVLRLFAATEQWFGFNENDVWTLFHSFAFDFSVWEIWGAWLHGGKLVVVPQETARDPAQHHALLLQQGVTVLNQTPSAFQQLVQLNAAPLPALRYVIFGGEALNHAALAPWFARHGDKQPALVNMYGITETTVHVTYQPLTQHGQQAAAVGIAIPDLAAHLLDAHLNPVPTGVAGELYIAGTGLARGYLGRAELTAERFIPDPFSGTGGRLYRTGDLARYLPDGTLEYLGRIDHQVKLRGFRIELGEIEAALAAQPAIRETLVLLREDMPGDARLVAYLTAEHVIEPDLLRKHLRQNLPDYMLPAHFVQLDQFPLTENGKINRKALPAPERSSTDSTAPRNEREARLAEIWAAVLRLEQIGIHDNFFALGGHSLLAVTLVDQLRKAGWQCDVRTLFAAPTIADLAALLADAREMAADVVVPPNLITAGAEHITPDMLPLATLGQADIERIIASTPGGVANVQDIYPMAPLQQGMLFHYQLETQGDAYLVKFQFAFADRARLDTFLAALQQVINRHDILRTAIVWQSLDEAMQVVWRNATLPVELATLDATDGDIAVQLDQRYDPRRVRLDLSQAPLMRAVIAQDEAQHRWVLHLLQHHMIDDNLTMQWLFAEIAQIINGQQAQLPPAQPFRNFIAQARFGASAAEHEAFFARTLGHIDTPTAPYDITEVHGDGSDVDDARLILPGALSQRIMQSARTHKVSSAVLMHLAWALVLARTTGRREVVFGTVLFGRMQGSDGADRIMGPCINTLPLCLRIDHADAATALQATQQALAGLMQHEHAPLAMAQRASGVEPPLPLFTALLNCRRTRGTAEQQPPMDGMSFIGMQERTNLPFVMAVDEWGDDFMLSAQTGAGIPAQRLCDYMQLALERLLDALATGAPLSRMDLLPAAERQLQLLDWNRTAADYPALPIHTLFAQQARQHPNDIAAEFAGSSLSYAELDRQANQLAHALLAQGVGAESLVGICAERSFEVLIGTLAILKAGAAYLPLDPGLPVQRLRYLLDDAAPALVLAAGPAWPALGLDDVPQLALEPASWQGQPIGAPAVVVYPDQLAYVMYTSGSTGQPKGVAVSHRNVVRLVRGATYYDLPTGGRILHVAAMTFDASTFEWWAPLLNGGRVAIAPAGRLTLAQLGNCIAGQDITLFLTTALFHQLVEHELPQLLQARQVLTGGEALSPAHANTFIAAGGRLVNCYGPTECTTYSTTHPMHGDVPSRIPIGRPIANAQMYVLDTQLNPVPQGVAGELYIGGDGLARGYLNRPELTAERFIPNPFGPTGTRLYRTGDLVRYLPNGDLDYLRRADQQVKLRGFRIELGEIEAALFALPGISSAAVLAREDEPGDKRLVAYWVAEAGSELTDADLRAQLQLQLPDYMVPARYMQLDSLPLMLNGKVDRKALPAPQQLASETDSYVAPRTETEAKLAAIWAEVLKLDRVGVDDNFFALGGHSLLATQIMSRTRREFGVDIPLAVIFETPTVAALAQRYDELQTLLRTDVLHEDDDLEEVEY